MLAAHVVGLETKAANLSLGKSWPRTQWPAGPSWTKSALLGSISAPSALENRELAQPVDKSSFVKCVLNTLAWNRPIYLPGAVR